MNYIQYFIIAWFGIGSLGMWLRAWKDVYFIQDAEDWRCWLIIPYGAMLGPITIILAISYIMEVRKSKQEAS